MGSKYKGYNYLSSHGEKFLDLSNEKVRARLTKKQQYYIEEYEKMYRTDLGEENTKYYLGLTDEIRAEIRYKQGRILTGQSYRESQRTYFSNYITGLMNMGQYGLADLLKKVANKGRGSKQRQGLIDNLSDLDLFYGRTAAANAQLDSDMITDAIGVSANVIINQAITLGIDVVTSKFSEGQLMDLAYAGYLTDETMEKIYREEKSKKNPNESLLERLEDIYQFDDED